MTEPHVVLIGPTAVGKSNLAMDIARRYEAFEIVVADSMQVYRGMDIGTAKPTATDRAEVAHHLVDVLDSSEEMSMADFLVRARTAVAEIEQRGHRALVVGGTGLYVQALVDGYEVPPMFDAVRSELENQETDVLYERLDVLDPVTAATLVPSNRRRIVRALEVTIGSGKAFSQYVEPNPGNYAMYGLWIPRKCNTHRIDERVDEMMNRGWLDEVRALSNAKGFSKTARRALGYADLLRHLAGDCDVDHAIAETKRKTKAFSRRQRVWFRRDTRIQWFGTGSEDSVIGPSVLADLASRVNLRGGQ